MMVQGLMGIKLGIVPDLGGDKSVKGATMIKDRSKWV